MLQLQPLPEREPITHTQPSPAPATGSALARRCFLLLALCLQHGRSAQRHPGLPCGRWGGMGKERATQRDDNRHSTGTGMCPCQRKCFPSGGPLALGVGQGVGESCEHQPFPLRITLPFPASGHPSISVSWAPQVWGGQV